MIKLSDIVGKMVIPNTMGQSMTPTLFEVDLETRFNAMRETPCSCLVVALLAHRDADGFEFSFAGIAHGMDPWMILERIYKPVIVLDLSKSFAEQWPKERIGAVDHPRDLENDPVICIPDYRNTPNVVPLAHFRPR